MLNIYKVTTGVSLSSALVPVVVPSRGLEIKITLTFQRYVILYV